MADYISKYPNGEAVDAQLDKAEHINRAVLDSITSDKIADAVITQTAMQMPTSMWLTPTVNRIIRNKDGLVNVQFVATLSQNNTISISMPVFTIPAGFRPAAKTAIMLSWMDNASSTTYTNYAAYIDSGGNVNNFTGQSLTGGTSSIGADILVNCLYYV